MSIYSSKKFLSLGGRFRTSLLCSCSLSRRGRIILGLCCYCLSADRHGGSLVSIAAISRATIIVSILLDFATCPYIALIHLLLYLGSQVMSLILCYQSASTLLCVLKLLALEQVHEVCSTASFTFLWRAWFRRCTCCWLCTTQDRLACRSLTRLRGLR